MFLKIVAQDGERYYINTDHVVRLSWDESNWEASLVLGLVNGERVETWDWEKRWYDEDADNWQKTAIEEKRDFWHRTRHQLRLFSRHQEEQFAGLEPSIEGG